MIFGVFRAHAGKIAEGEPLPLAGGSVRLPLTRGTVTSTPRWCARPTAMEMAWRLVR